MRNKGPSLIPAFCSFCWPPPPGSSSLGSAIVRINWVLGLRFYSFLGYSTQSLATLIGQLAEKQPLTNGLAKVKFDWPRMVADEMGRTTSPTLRTSRCESVRLWAMSKTCDWLQGPLHPTPIGNRVQERKEVQVRPNTRSQAVTATTALAWYVGTRASGRESHAVCSNTRPCSVASSYLFCPRKRDKLCEFALGEVPEPVPPERPSVRLDGGEPMLLAMDEGLFKSGG